MNLLFTVIVPGLISLSFAAQDPIKWCVISEVELTKCKKLRKAMDGEGFLFECVKRNTVHECIEAIKNNVADAITLDGGDIYESGLLTNGRLKPIAAEQITGETCYYAVAVVHASSTFNFNQLEGKRSCHTGLGKSAGWIIPIGTLLAKYPNKWQKEDQIEKFASDFFSSSCVPGADKIKFKKLCMNCNGTKQSHCKRSHEEPFYDYTGAFNCLAKGKGDVAFVKHTTVPADQKQNYRLLCKDGSKMNIDQYKKCNLARVPAHAVMVRSEPDDDVKNKNIWKFLSRAQERFGQDSTGTFKLFQSVAGQKNLMFKDSTQKLVHLSSGMDYRLYLGPAYITALKTIRKESSGKDGSRIRWCTIGNAEKAKCDNWVSGVDCVSGTDAEDCIKKVMFSEADAVTLDGGQIYLAEKCGLIAVMSEYYNKKDHELCKHVASAQSIPSYYAVAVVKDLSLTWETLKGKKSCHTALGRTAGWIMPIGTLVKEGKIKPCEIYNSSYFSASCAPGAKNINPKLCSLCGGMKSKLSLQDKCAANSNEKYFSYSGAFRCLVDVGDVAFVKHTTVPENTDGNGVLDWNRNLKSINYRLLCPNNKVVNVDRYKECNLAKVPAHAVVTRAEKRTDVVKMLKEQQVKHGLNGTQTAAFEMFNSKKLGKDLLFKDSTQCLIEFPKSSQSFLDTHYVAALEALYKCKPPALLFADDQLITWCTISTVELSKCNDLKDVMKSNFECIMKDSVEACLSAIKNGNADAITVDGGDIYKGGLLPHPRLKPIIAEVTAGGFCYYAVAVVKNESNFGFHELLGQKSCHTGLGKSSGWIVPVGSILKYNLTSWNGVNPIEQVVANFFSASCVPGANATFPTLCELCIGEDENKCKRSHEEPYYDYSGAFQCLKDGAGDVAFVKHSTVPAAEEHDYELLCLNGKRMPVMNYTNCHWAKVPAHAVVVRSGDTEKAKNEAIWNFLSKAQELFGRRMNSTFNLFNSSKYGQKNLMFKDSTQELVHLPSGMDFFLYLGSDYVHAIQILENSESSILNTGKIRWCAIGDFEMQKCESWGTVRCVRGENAEDCIRQIKYGDADAATFDGGEVYIGGKCGLVPVMAEYYDKSTFPLQSSYFAVAVVKDPSLTWNKLKGKKSCHTAVERTAGWNVPMGTLVGEGLIQACDIYNSTYFNESCAPGANAALYPRLCSLCIGNEASMDKCAANSNERYFSYSGAFRCLVESGDVAFVKHTTVSENTDTDGNGEMDWNKNLSSKNYYLLCKNGSIASVNQFLDCHLADVPAHAVMTRPDKKVAVLKLLKSQQLLYGRNGTMAGTFQMFSSSTFSGKNLLFKDSTQCLIEIPQTNYEDFLGDRYINILEGLHSCKSPDLLEACAFKNC
ncbi:uncharacterized protein LOC144599072 [Rhinoraja longicauda]